MYDFIIIGGGIVGMSTAMHLIKVYPALAHFGHQVTTVLRVQVIDIGPALGIHRRARCVSRRQWLNGQQLGGCEGVKVCCCFGDAGQSRFGGVGEEGVCIERLAGLGRGRQIGVLPNSLSLGERGPVLIHDQVL